MAAILHYITIVVLFLLTNSVYTQFVSKNNNKDILTQNQLADILEIRESQIKSAYCEFECLRRPTTEHTKKLIYQHLKLEPESYIFSEENAKRFSCKMNIWIKKNKYKEVQSPLFEVPDFYHTTTAFDGQILRSFTSRNHELIGASISDKDSSKLSENSPFIVSLYYRNTPLSQVIRTAAEFRHKRTKNIHEVHVVCSKDLYRNQMIDFQFDENLNIISRQDTLIVEKDFHHMHTRIYLEDYRPYTLDSGEIVFFPYKSTRNGYNTPKGVELFVLGQEVWTVNKMQFNIPISDSFFELEIPKSAPVNDRITGLGWLPPGERPANLFPQDARRRLWWTIGIVGLVITAFLAWLTIRYRNRRHRLAKA